MPGTSHNNDDLNPSGLILPAYVVLRKEGVFINLTPPPAQDILILFVDRLFSSGSRFAGLDYARFSNLLFGDYSEGLFNGVEELRISDSLVHFPAQRLDLYRSVKITASGDRAEYMFEPVFVEVLKEEPIYGEPDDDGIMHVIDHKKYVDTHPTKLDFDEFVAGMWLKGVRYGINANVVREAIRRGFTGRLNVAVQLEPTESKDAVVVEECDAMRQDNTPLILPNGKADLRRAKNRFPQVAKNTPLLRKVPRSLGKPGYRVTGELLEARIPLDIDMSKLAGEGTSIVNSPKGELLIANMDGFIVLDERTNEIWVTAKIENRGGISAKSTGDISLTVDEYVEHGEVQEGRIVDGKHLTFLSDVFGTVLSQGGNIVLDKNLSGGQAKSVGGNVTVNGKVINATLEAWEGKITADFAEGSTIIGKSVSIGRAVNCEIIAEELELKVAEGCAIAGKSMHIHSSNVRKHRETIVTVLLPDIEGYDKQIGEAKKNLAQVEQTIQAKHREITSTQTDLGFARYLALAEKVRSGSVTLTAEQQVGWQKIVNQYAPVMRSTEGLLKKREALADIVKRLTQARASSSVGEYCKIDEVSGETVVRKSINNLGTSLFRDLPQQELKTILNKLGAEQERIFSGHRGQLDWHFKSVVTSVPLV